MGEATSPFQTDAERKAEGSQSLRAFEALSLFHIRNSVAELLAQIGRNGLFDQYTVHDISHIDKMLHMLDWLIPASGRRAMTPADWLMVVLGIYFHDLGMVVTRKEFEARGLSGYVAFRESVYGGDQYRDYIAKIQKFASADEGERFLYQEFVRENHATRIRLWVSGEDSLELGVSEDASRQVRQLVEPLGEKFCRDLGIVCESHHLEDLKTLAKYKPSQPYGDSTEETVNLQYAAVMLRTADLLHVTKDRAPSVSFQLINPTDPTSIEEWMKQMAVVAVRSKVAVNRDGIADPALPRDTVEVHAYFTKPGGFFSLTRYLQYVEAELKKSQEWVKHAAREAGVGHEFPWRQVDGSNVETKGFLSRQFVFTLDQAKIMDLLTGHTLYNDIKVVTRELAQNAIDAVRLQALQSNLPIGAVHIKWDSKLRILTVEDTGTGMSQDVIENHLLKVGSSLYQDAEFQKQNPTFSPISRFGIGALSTFMIADEVEIITSHERDEQARQLSLRSVHGKYLIRLLDKRALPEPLRGSGHGTIIRLAVRASVQMPDVLATAKLWIVFPRCDVFVSQDDQSPIRIGFSSARDAVEEYCDSLELAQGSDTKVVEVQVGSVAVAFALQWDDFFSQWAFVTPAFRDRDDEDEARPRLGLCVEGVRVTEGTPGYPGYPIVAIANATGPTAPKTNVARSGLEATPQRDLTLSSIYEAFCGHVTAETLELYQTRSFSMTWAAKEAKFLMEPLFSRDADLRADEPAPSCWQPQARFPACWLKAKGQEAPYPRLIWAQAPGCGQSIANSLMLPSFSSGRFPDRPRSRRCRAFYWAGNRVCRANLCYVVFRKTILSIARRCETRKSPKSLSIEARDEWTFSGVQGTLLHAGSL